MRQNNFDIVRLLLAAIVVLVHSANLSQSPALAFIPRLLSQHVAVEGFFAISGFLIFASYERCETLREYARNRAVRILPGYWLSTLLCLAIAAAYGSFHVGRFILANLTFSSFLQPDIQGVFPNNPENHALNGALWTLKIEVMFYIAVPIIVFFCRKWRRDAVLWALFAASVLFRIALAGHQSLAVQLPGQLCFFLVGTLIHYHLPFFKQHGKLLMIGALALHALHLYTGWFFLRPLSVASLTLGACLLLPHVQGPTRYGDFSYGTYILHYPIVQCIIAAGLFTIHPWMALGLTILIVACAAQFSWFLVEKPALTAAKSRQLRRAAIGAAPNFPPAVP